MKIQTNVSNRKKQNTLLRLFQDEQEYLKIYAGLQFFLSQIYLKQQDTLLLGTKAVMLQLKKHLTGFTTSVQM